MAKTSNNYSSLLKSLGNSGRQVSTLTAEASMKAGQNSGVKAASIGSNNTSTGINFGKAPSNKVAASTGTNWTQFLEQAASGGLASAFSGGFGLGDVTGGIGSLASGIASLFGGNKKAPAPLVPFQLPAAQNQTITVGANGASGTGSASTMVQNQSAQIAQAVKTALLTSSSLNDVISEI